MNKSINIFKRSNFIRNKKFSHMEDYEGGFHSSAPKREYTGIKTLRSLTAKQIYNLDAGENSSIYLIDNAEVSNIQLCGYITSIKRTSAGTSFSLDDTTAVAECTFWANSGYDEIVSERILEGNLVKVIGSLKVFANKKNISCSSIVIVNTDIFIYHLTSALYQHLYYNNKLDRSDVIKKSGNATMNKMQNDILSVYRSNQDDNGLDIDVVVNMLQGKYSANEIRETIDNLLTDCHLYSVDGTSYKTTG